MGTTGVLAGSLSQKNPYRGFDQLQTPERRATDEHQAKALIHVGSHGQCAKFTRQPQRNLTPQLTVAEGPNAACRSSVSFRSSNRPGEPQPEKYSGGRDERLRLTDKPRLQPGEYVTDEPPRSFAGSLQIPGVARSLEESPPPMLGVSCLSHVSNWSGFFP